MTPIALKKRKLSFDEKKTGCFANEGQNFIDTSEKNLKYNIFPENMLLSFTV